MHPRLQRFAASAPTVASCSRHSLSNSCQGTALARTWERSALHRQVGGDVSLRLDDHTRLAKDRGSQQGHDSCQHQVWSSAAGVSVLPSGIRVHSLQGPPCGEYT